MGQFSFQRPDTDIPVDEKPTAFKRPASDVAVTPEKKSPVHNDSDNGPIDFITKFPSSSAPADGTSILGPEVTAQEKDNQSGFRVVDTDKLPPTLPAHNNSIDLSNSEVEIEKQQAQYKKDHPDTGTWSNALPTLFHATLGVVTKGAAGIGNIARDISGLAEPAGDTKETSSAKALYKEDPWGQNTGELTEYGKKVDAGKTRDALGKMIIGLDAYNNETAKTDYENHLPQTFLGNTATGLINIAPIAATAALFPEAELAEGAEATQAGVNLAALQKLKTIAYNPFTKVSAIQGGLNAYDEAKQKGETPGQAVIEGTEGLLKEGGQAAVYNILGEFGANYLSPKLAKSLTESGIIKNGKLTRMGTDAASDAIIFGAYPIASNLIQGKPVDWDEVEQGIGTGFAFGIPKAMHVYGDYSEADSQLKQTGDAVAMKNFYDAAPEAIQQAYKLPDNVIDLNAQAVDYAAKAKAETDLGKRKELIAASSMYQKLADVKTVTQSVLGDPTEYIDNINASTDLTDEQKAGLINKIKKVPSIISGVAKPDPINNFADATPEDMVNAMQRPETADELQSMAYEKALAAQNATDPELQASLNAEHQELQKHSDIKTIGNTVIEHGFNNFHDAVNNSDFPDDLKSTLISKAHGITQEFNPVVKEQAETQQTVTDLSSKIDDLQATPGATDPVTNPAGVNELIDLVEKRTDAQVDLLDKVQLNPDQLPTQAQLKAADWEKIPGVKANIDWIKSHEESDRGLAYLENPLQDHLAQDANYEKNIKEESDPNIIENNRTLRERNQNIIDQLQAIEDKYKPDEQAQKETETAAPEPGANISDNSENDRLQTTPVTADHEEFGKLKFSPEENGEFSIQYQDGTADKLSDEEIKRVFHIDPKTGEEFVPPEEDVVNQQRSGGEWMHPDQVEASQKLLEKVFPNIETIFHPTTAEFAEAARANGIDGETLPNAFIDKTGKINFNPESINKDTQLHEYGHILVQWAQEKAPALYQRMISFGRDATEIHKELLANGYKLTKKRLAEEAFVTMLGKHGEGKLDEAIKNGGTRGTIAKLINDLWNKFQRYLIEKTGLDISRFKNIKNMPLNEFLDTINSKYLLSENKIGDIGTKPDTEVEQQRQGRPIKREDETFADFARRVIDWTREQQTGQHVMDFTGESEKPEEKAGYTFNETSIKNRVTAEERRARLLDEVEVTAKRDFGNVWENAKNIVEKDRNSSSNTTQAKEYLPISLAKEIINNPRPLSAEETGILLYGRMQLYNDHRATMDNINDAIESGNTAIEAQERVRLSIIENNIDQNDEAAKKAGYEQGLGLAARKMIAAQDYSLANQLQLAKLANGGKQVPADVRVKIETLTKQLESTQKELDNYKSNQAARVAVTSLARMRKEVENEKRIEKTKKRTKTAEQIDQSIATRKQAIYDKLFKNKSATSSPIPYADRLVEITPDLALLAKDYIRKGINTVEGLVDQLHDDFKDHLEGLTKRDLRDALSGYGKTSKPSKDTIEAKLRELKSQARLTSALEDAQRGELPLKSGYTHDMPSETVRELQKKVHDAMRENGIEVEHKKISDEDAWKSALESVKTRLKNEIQDLNKQLETGVRPDKKASVIRDQEAIDLKAERDRLKATIDEVEGDKELTDEQRVELLMKSTQKSIDEYQERIDNILNPKPGEEAPKKTSVQDLVDKTPELKTLRDRLSELKDIHDNLKDEAKPKLTPEEVALYDFKKRMASKIAELQDRIDRGDYAPAPEQPKLVLDDHAKYLQSESNRLKRKIDSERNKLKIKNLPRYSKIAYWGSKWVRFALLSHPATILKLGAAGAMRIVISPLEEVIGSGLSYIPGLSEVSAKAPREGGGINFEAEVKALATVFSKKTYSEAYRTAKEGKSELDDRLDDASQKAHNEDGFLAIPGHIHAAEKTVPKLNEYYRALTKRIDFALRNGYDITNPDTQTSIQINAFKDNNPKLFYTKTTDFSDIDQKAIEDARRAIFMQDNKIANVWNVALRTLELQGPKGEIYANLLRIFIPITKIPTNYVAEGTSYAAGVFKGAAVLFKGIEKLTPDEADYVLRNFKKQGIGAAFFALGWVLKNSIGGYYNANDGQEKKRKKSEPGADEVMIDDTTMPHWLFHAPLMETLQMGATSARISENYKRNNKESTLDEVGQNLAVSGNGLFGQVPFISAPSDLARSTENTSNLTKYITNFVIARVAPLGIQNLAQTLDKDSKGNPIKRQTKGFEEEVQSHIPIEREKLHKKK